ncbi:MAG: CoA pyrophosphatase [Bacteroidota bacterium]
MPLPGQASHFKMEPEMRKVLRENGQMSVAQAKKAAVMALFYPKSDGCTHLLLILRKKYAGVHSHQIGFPGGKWEQEDQDLLQTAKRETFEEVGVPQKDIHVIKALTEVFIPPSNYRVSPFLGLYTKPKPFIREPREVEALVEVRLEDLLDSVNQGHERLSTSYAKDITVPTYSLNNYTVWGATAMMLSEVRDLLLQVL